MPTKEQLIHFLNDKHDRLLMLYAGFALVHPKDRFHKKVGREVADSKQKPITFKIKQITFDDLDNMEFKLIPIDSEERIKSLTFKTFSSKNRVYLIYARIS